MSESMANIPCFQQSVSFGRFEHDSLSWERWSTFPTNKYLEEVEKFSTPGSVAQKKAYFEAHYKRIAARKAELLLEQDRKEEAELVDFEDRVRFVCNTKEEVLDVEKHDVQNSVENEQVEDGGASFTDEVCVVTADTNIDSSEVFDQDIELADLPSELSERMGNAHTINDVCELVDFTSEKSEPFNESDDDVHITGVINEVVKTEVTEHIAERNEDTDVIDEVVKYEVIEHVDGSKNGTVMMRGNNTLLQVEDASEDFCPAVKIPELEKPLEPVSVTENVSCILEFIDDRLASEKVKGTMTEDIPKNLKLRPIPKTIEKATLTKKTIHTTKTTKKPASPIARRPTISTPKSPMLSTPKSLKPELTKTAKSAYRPLDKKENGPTPLTSKKKTGSESKRLAPTSLHMSLNLGPANTDPSSATTRKPLIMERMGDKDIVRRAFKAFQSGSQVSQSPLAESPTLNQSALGKFERKGSPAGTLKKKNEGIGKVAKTAGTRTGQQGIRKTQLSPGLTKNVGAEPRQVKSVSASFGPPVQLHGNKKTYQSQPSRKLEIKPKANKFEATHLHPKVDKAAQMVKPSQISTCKPKLSSSYNQGHGFFKKFIHKDDRQDISYQDGEIIQVDGFCKLAATTFPSYSPTKIIMPASSK